MIKVVVLNNGLKEVRNLLDSSITHAQSGTDGTVPSQNDSGLFAEVSATLLSTTSIKSSNPATLTITHVISVTQGNGNNLQEWELRVNGNADSFNRTVTAPMAKIATEEFTRIVTVEITQD